MLYLQSSLGNNESGFNASLQPPMYLNIVAGTLKDEDFPSFYTALDVQTLLQYMPCHSLHNVPQQ